MSKRIEELERRNKPIPRREPETRVVTYEADEPADRFRKVYGPSDPVERAEWLIERAEAIEEDANRMEGTCYYGDVSPSESRRAEASLLREQADLLLNKARKRREPRP